MVIVMIIDNYKQLVRVLMFCIGINVFQTVVLSVLYHFTIQSTGGRKTENYDTSLVGYLTISGGYQNFGLV